MTTTYDRSGSRFGSLAVLWLVMAAAYVYLLTLFVGALLVLFGGFGGGVIVVGSTMGSSLLARFAGFVFESAILTNFAAPVSVMVVSGWSAWLVVAASYEKRLPEWLLVGTMYLFIPAALGIGFSGYLAVL